MKKILRRVVDKIRVRRSTPRQPLRGIQDLVRSGAAVWHPAPFDLATQRPAPRQLGGRHIDWPALLPRDRYPQAGVVELPVGWSLTSAGWPLSRRRELLVETTVFGTAPEELRVPFGIRRRRKLEGTALSLLSDYADINYFHFVLDALGRYATIETLAKGLPGVDHILCPAPFAVPLQRWIDLLGVDRRKIIAVHRGEQLSPQRLLVPSFPGARRDPPPWTIDFWRDRFASSRVARPSRRLFISRRGISRGLINEAELTDALVSLGFEIIDAAQVATPEQLYPLAAILVGVQGAGLTNALLCAPGSWLVEITPTDQLNPTFYALAGSARLNFAYAVGESEQVRPPGTWGPSPHDLRVDVDALVRGIRPLLT